MLTSMNGIDGFNAWIVKIPQKSPEPNWLGNHFLIFQKNMPTTPIPSTHSKNTIGLNKEK